MSQPDRSKLPIRRQPFAGVANRTLDGSQPDWEAIGHVDAPDGAPNILLVLIDDAGFGNPATFGGPINTPNYSRIAQEGLRYNRFHVAALCSPTRAALLTGRNSHTVGFGSVGEFSTGFAGYTAFVPDDCVPLPRILRDNGYSTAAFGKWHLTPDGQQGPAGPFDRWPVGWGFDYFYGFLGGGSGQWDPCLAENQKVIGTPEAFYDEENPYYLPDDMANKTIEWLHAIRAQDASKPFFAYFSTGCSHAPHHVSEQWAAKYKGKFDQGWDRLREETFARQKELGVIPADAELTPRDDAFPAWDDVPDKLKAYYARQMEVYAGYSENADHNVGRTLDAIEELGELDNTLVLWIWGDNGASMEGTITGSFNELTMQNGIPLTDEMQLQLSERYGGIEAWGNQMMAPHYSAAWAWAGNTPFKWGKQVGSHLGGTRNPLVVHWPETISEDGALRSHFTHVIDVGPTILDIAGIPMPTHIDGIEQQPMHGFTFADSLTDADAPERHTQQYFETIGNRAMYKDGWWLSMKTARIPWVSDARGPPALRPRGVGPRCRSDRALLPARRLQPGERSRRRAPREGAGAKRAVLGGGREVQRASADGPACRVLRHVPAAPGDRQVRVSRRCPERPLRHDPADLQPLLHDQRRARDPVGRRRGGDRRRGRPPGRVLAVRRRRQAHAYLLDDGCLRVSPAGRGDSARRRGDGAHGVRRRRGETGHRRRGDAVHRRSAGRQGRMDHTVPIRFSGYAGMDIGRDNGGVVDPGYETRKPFAFTGKIRRVVFDVNPHPSAEEAHGLHSAVHHGHTAHAITA